MQLTCLFAAAALAAPQITSVEHRGDTYHVVTIDLRDWQLDLVGQRPGGARSLDALDGQVIATNAGIFHTPNQPVGLWVEDGVTLSPLDTDDGFGNFYLKPNGVFAVDGHGARVTESDAFSPTPTLRIATQSGPLLVANGALHPRFDPESTNRKQRSGVGVSDAWTVRLVVSDGPVRFYDLATLFRDRLGCDDALYLDGTISALRAPGVPERPAYDYAGLITARPRVTARLQDGDIVFQRSRSAQSTAIAQATGSRWTHTGLVRIKRGEPWVLEATQPVKWTPLDRWIAAGEGPIAVRRWAEPIWTPAALAKLDALAARWVGRPYDARFEPGDDALYCSELVREAALQAAGVELAPLKPLGSYAIADPALRARIVARWGTVPDALMVVAPSDLADAPGMITVPWPQPAPAPNHR